MILAKPKPRARTAEEFARQRFDGSLRDRAREVFALLEQAIRRHEERVLGHEIDEPEPIDWAAFAPIVQLAILGRVGDEP